MYASYHNHTTRCGHASGTEREYIERAIENGYKIFGFSDHTPQFYEGDYYPVRSKMRPEAMNGYVDTVLALKKEYERDIKIRLGLEVEYYPARFGRLMDFLGQYPLEYMLLGVTEGRHYPNPWFWEMVPEIGNDVVFGADAHRIDRVADLPAQRKAEEMARSLHLHVLPDLEDRLK